MRQPAEGAGRKDPEGMGLNHPLPGWAESEPMAGRQPSRIPPRLEVADTGLRTMDRAMLILAAVEQGASVLTHMVDATGLPKPTVYRIARSMEAHGLLARDPGGSWRLGPHLFALATEARRDLPLARLAQPALDRLAEATGETAQLYVRDGDRRLCVATSESSSELRTIVPVGATLPLSAGSAAMVFLSWATPEQEERWLAFAREPEWKAGTADWRDRVRQRAVMVRRRGFAASVEDRQKGVASVSAPVFTNGRTHDASANPPIAVVSISGPVGRLGRTPGNHYAPAVMAAAREIERALGEPT